MVKIERQVAFSGTKDVAEPLRFDAERPGHQPVLDRLGTERGG